jgi:phosphosulfolactate phosphohydrolase-like enzyme
MSEPTRFLQAAYSVPLAWGQRGRRKPRLRVRLGGCGSGRELSARGFEADVVHAAELGAYDAVPVMRNGWLRRWN